MAKKTQEEIVNLEGHFIEKKNVNKSYNDSNKRAKNVADSQEAKQPFPSTRQQSDTEQMDESLYSNQKKPVEVTNSGVFDSYYPNPIPNQLRNPLAILPMTKKRANTRGREGAKRKSSNLRMRKIPQNAFVSN